MAELKKGNLSCWGPFLESIPDTPLFCEWQSKTVSETRDPYLKEQYAALKDDLKYLQDCT
jgi:hypothetical protein